MSIASEITRLQGVKSNILQAISDKGVTVPAGSALDDCPALIGDISGNPAYLLKTDFSNFDVATATDYPEVGSPAVLTDNILSFTKSNTSNVTGENVSSLIGTAPSGNVPNGSYGYEVSCNEEFTAEIVTKSQPASVGGLRACFFWTSLPGVADFAIASSTTEPIQNRFVITSSLNIATYNATLTADSDGFKIYNLMIGNNHIFWKYTFHFDVPHSKVYIYCGDIILFVINNLNISGTYRMAFDPRDSGTVECTSIIAYKGAPKSLNL